MATLNIPDISDAQLTELEKLARAQERTVDEVLGEPWTNTSNRSSWAALKNTDVPSRASWASPRRNVPCHCGYQYLHQRSEFRRHGTNCSTWRAPATSSFQFRTISWMSCGTSCGTSSGGQRTRFPLQPTGSATSQNASNRSNA
jgi:hypothetical protein